MPGGVALLLAALAAPASVVAAPAAPSDTVVLQGLSGAPVSLTAQDLSRLPQAHVAITHGGQTHDYAGPELAGLLRQVDAPIGVRMHGRAVSTVVVVTARDGYRVALSLGEIDPDLHPGAKVILADQVDGHALPANEAPARLVVGGDSHPARDARMVSRIALAPAP